MTVGVCLSVCVFFGKIRGKVMNGLNKSVHTFTLLNESKNHFIEKECHGKVWHSFHVVEQRFKITVINY